MDHVIWPLAVLRYSGPTILVVLGMVAPAEGGANFRSYIQKCPMFKPFLPFSYGQD